MSKFAYRKCRSGRRSHEIFCNFATWNGKGRSQEDAVGIAPRHWDVAAYWRGSFKI